MTRALKVETVTNPPLQGPSPLSSTLAMLLLLYNFLLWWSVLPSKQMFIPGVR
jgi:hypothetical protein